MLGQVGLPDPGRVEGSYPHELSGGMLQRVMIAMGSFAAPRLLIADEPTTALDVTIQQQILELVETLHAETGMAVVWVTHDLGVVARLVDRVAVMSAGGLSSSLRPATSSRGRRIGTRRPCLSLPGPTTEHRKPLRQIGGSPPDPAQLAGGCPFRFRCSSADEHCAVEEPPLIGRGPGQKAACWKEPSTWVK